MHIKGKGRAEGTQILCQGHGKGKAKRVSALGILWREVPKWDEGLVTTSSSCVLVTQEVGVVHACGWRRTWQGSVGWEAPGHQDVLWGWVLMTFSVP